MANPQLLWALVLLGSWTLLPTEGNYHAILPGWASFLNRALFTPVGMPRGERGNANHLDGSGVDELWGFEEKKRRFHD